MAGRFWGDCVRQALSKGVRIKAAQPAYDHLERLMKEANDKDRSDARELLKQCLDKHGIKETEW